MGVQRRKMLAPTLSSVIVVSVCGFLEIGSGLARIAPESSVESHYSGALRYAVIDSPSDALPATAAERESLEHETLSRIQQRLTPLEWEHFRQSLSEQTAWSVRGDAELSQLFATLYSIRAAKTGLFRN
jgi:hypothetical protein